MHQNDSPQEPRKSVSNGMNQGIGIGLALGAGIGIALGNIALG